MNPQKFKVVLSNKKRKSGKIFVFNKFTKKWMFKGFKAKKIPEYKRIEFKALDTYSTVGSMPLFALYTGSTGIILLNSIQEGTDMFNRIGRKICNRSLLLKYWLTATAFAATTSDANFHQVSIAIVWDKFPQAVSPVYSDIFSDGVGLTNVQAWSSPFLVNRNRFKVLGRHLMNLGVNSSAAMSNSATNSPFIFQGQFWFRWSAGKLMTIFNSSGSGISSIENGAIYLVYTGSTAVATNACYYLNFISRHRFTNP